MTDSKLGVKEMTVFGWIRIVRNVRHYWDYCSGYCYPTEQLQGGRWGGEQLRGARKLLQTQRVREETKENKTLSHVCYKQISVRIATLSK